MNYWHC